MPAAKTGYHHHDLPATLVRAGLELTREGGPDALGIREVTRRAGVTPTAAYRHFADRQALLRAVAAEIQDMVAERMRAQPRPRGGTSASRARARLRAVGVGYIEFALDEPGWFAVAFYGASGEPAGHDAGRQPPPYVTLVEALDALAEAGVLAAEQREQAEWPCWSAVHGFAELALRGPLHGRSRRLLLRLGARTVDAIIAGVCTQKRG